MKFEKDGAFKETDKKFKDDLIAIGWVVVKDKPKPAKKKKENAFSIMFKKGK